MSELEGKLKVNMSDSKNRFEFWIRFVKTFNFKNILEVGVYKGEFAFQLLRSCDSIEKYFLIDPWRKIDDWNKPANTTDSIFQEYFLETKSRLKFAHTKTFYLRGKTTEVINGIDNDVLDFAYVDGDHTLKGITIDLINIWNKIKYGGYIAGDDFCPSIWQHDNKFEPSLIFPYAVYFAEAVQTKIFALPFNQFLIQKSTDGFQFIDLTEGRYVNKSILSQLRFQNNKGRKKTRFFNFKK